MTIMINDDVFLVRERVDKILVLIRTTTTRVCLCVSACVCVYVLCVYAFVICVQVQYFERRGVVALPASEGGGLTLVCCMRRGEEEFHVGEAPYNMLVARNRE